MVDSIESMDRVNTGPMPSHQPRPAGSYGFRKDPLAESPENCYIVCTMKRLSPNFVFLALVAANIIPISASDRQGTPWNGGPGVVESVKTLMERDASVTRRVSATRPPRYHPLHRPDRSSLADAFTTPLAANPAPSLLASSLPAQTLGLKFTGATLSDTGSFPPDTIGAAGPSQFIVACNGRLRSFNKSTGVKDGAVDLDMDVFFQSVMTPLGGQVVDNFTTDSHIRYDRLSERWFIVMIDAPSTSSGSIANRIMIAVSSGSVITSSSSFTFFQFRHDQPTTAGSSGTNADYPTPGIDANAIYIGDSVFSNSTGSFLGSAGFVIRKSSLTSGGPIVVTAFRNLTTASSDGPFTPQGVDNYDPAAKEGYFIGTANSSFGKLVIRRVTDPGGTPSISGNLNVTVPATHLPIKVPHLGNTNGSRGGLDPVDDRLFAAHIRNGRLWTAHNIEVDATGTARGTGARDGSRWYELANLDTTPTLAQSGTVFDPATSNPKSYWIPSLMVSGQGHVALGFSSAGAASYINAATCGRLASDPPGTMRVPVEYTASSTTYNPSGDTGSTSGRRWGDYSYTSLDPQDDMTMWTIQQFCNTTNQYALRVVKLIAPPPATPSSCNPSTIPAGNSSVSVVVTGSQVSGSGFYDPGTGFAKRIKASVTNGVVVSRITYNSPTIVTLVLNTVAATPGLQNITVTNPDGQSRTGQAILTVGPAPLAVSATAYSATPLPTGQLTNLNQLATDGHVSSARALTVRDQTLVLSEISDGVKYQSLTVIKTPGTRYQPRFVEVSPNLLDWFSGVKHTTVMQDDEFLLRVRDNTPLVPGVKRFIRSKPKSEVE